MFGVSAECTALDAKTAVGLGGLTLGRSGAGNGFDAVGTFDARCGTVLVRDGAFDSTGDADFGVAVGTPEARCGTVLVRDGALDSTGDADLGGADARCGTVLARDTGSCGLFDAGACAGGSSSFGADDSVPVLGAVAGAATIAPVAVSPAASASSVGSQSESKSSVLGVTDEAKGFVMVTTKTLYPRRSRLPRTIAWAKERETFCERESILRGLFRIH